MSTPTGATRGSRSWSTTPTQRIGWVAVIAAIIGLGAWIVLPLITTLFRETVPVTDTVVMPIIGVVLTLVAAVLNVLALTAWRQRNVLNLIAALLTAPAALVFLVFLVGEGLAGA
ncbi:MAG TPA: hypothetical protein VF156_08555 [Agromyces sp.]